MRSPTEWDLPQWLFVGLSVVLAIGILIGLSTTGVAFGIYNPSWDGAAELTGVAEASGTESQVILNTTAYERVQPNQTAIVVLSPGEGYTSTERTRVREFVRDGGTLIVAEDFGPVGNQLLAAVGATARFDGRVVRDERHYGQTPALPVATNVSDSLTQAGVTQLTLNYATVLAPPTSNNSSVLVRTSEFAYLDRDRDGELDDNETLERRPVVVRESVGNGTVISISDPSLFINAMLEAPDNRAFATALFRDHTRVILDYSGYRNQPPLSVALLHLRQSPLLQAIAVLSGAMIMFAVSRRRQIHQGLPSWLRPSQESEPPVSRSDPESIRRFVSRQHPDWDRERIDRVIAGILRHEDGENRDE